ncbi:MAG TPA: peptidase domain-containing ABC transporter [Pyrinomonadaceae bacterium]
MDLTELKRLLKDTTVLSVLSDEDLTQLADRVELVHYSLGQPVCRAGDAADAFYLVYSGRARVLATNNGTETTVGLLTRGNYFGEQGLLTDSRRHYTVRAASDLTLLRLSREGFDQLLAQRPDLQEYFRKYIAETSIRNFLKLCTVLAPLTPAEIRDLLGVLKLVEFDAGQHIIREGDAGDAFYILRSGSAEVVKESDGGKVLARLKEGDAFGELALLTGQPRAASVVTRAPASVFRLEKADFDRIIAAAPKVREALVNMAAGYSQAAVAAAAAAVPASPTEELPPAPEPAADGYKPKRARRYPALLQLSEMDCGAACMAMILRYYRKHVSINRLRDLVNVSREGATLYSVAEGAERLGFHARGIRAAYEHLAKIDLPAIAHWEGYHYIVLYEVGADYVVVADPAIGRRRLSRAEFEKGWTGYLLLLQPTPRLEGVEESKTTFGRFLPLLKPYRPLLFEIFLASLLLQLFGLASPVFTQVIVDKVLVHKNVAMLNLLLVGMCIVAVFQTATTALRYYLLVHTTRRIDMQMVVDFYRHILSLPMRYFEERKVGDIIKRFNDNARIRAFLTGRALSVVLDCLMIVVYLWLMFYYNLKLTLVALLFMPGYAALTFGLTPILKRQYRETFNKAAEADSHMVESVTGVGTVKATATERRVRWKLEGLIVKSLNVEFRAALTGMAANSVSNILQTLNTVILFWYGARLVIQGELSVGQLVAFNLLVGNVTRPVLSLIDLWREFQEVNIALERLNEVFDAKPEEELAKPGLIHAPHLRGHIKFEHVTFRYPTRPDKNALQNISLEVYPGQTVALVGRSGSGKSTFANMLLRLHEPNEGRILIDGYDLRQLSISSLRAQVGVVPQEIFLFSGTIRENIAFGDPDAPLERVVGAALLAGAHEFISELPLGYETKIGERGQSLSGGQKQRVAIARALFKQPRILIFDEATSALDTESERAIQQNLDQILKHRTTFIIAHRLSTVRNADLIVVMDKGAIIELGTHYSLMEEKGMYYYLNSQQLEG